MTHKPIHDLRSTFGIAGQPLVTITTPPETAEARAALVAAFEQALTERGELDVIEAITEVTRPIVEDKIDTLRAALGGVKPPAKEPHAAEDSPRTRPSDPATLHAAESADATATATLEAVDAPVGDAFAIAKAFTEAAGARTLSQSQMHDVVNAFLRLEPRAERPKYAFVQGHVFNEGAPVAGAPIEATWCDHFSGVDGRATTVTAEDGYFSVKIKNLPTWQPITVTIDAGKGAVTVTEQFSHGEAATRSYRVVRAEMPTVSPPAAAESTPLTKLLSTPVSAAPARQWTKFSGFVQAPEAPPSTYEAVAPARARAGVLITVNWRGGSTDTLTDAYGMFMIKGVPWGEDIEVTLGEGSGLIKVVERLDVETGTFRTYRY